MDSCYVPLHLQSNYSLLRGTATIDGLAEFLRTGGFAAAALADRNNLYGAFLFHERAREAGVRPIVAVELDGPEGEVVVLLARNRTGYGNLCRLITLRMTEERFDPIERIPEHAEGLFVLAARPADAERLRPGLSPGVLWMEIPLWAGPRKVRELRRAARRLGAGVVAGGAATLAEGTDAPLQRMLAAIRLGALAADTPPEERADPAGRPHDPGEASALFREFPEALANTRVLAEACDLNLLEGGTIFPRYPLPEGETAYSLLHRLAQEGLRRRYGSSVTPEVTRRLQTEMEAIHRLGFPDYFLVVGDLVRFARSRGIPTVGRGSGAGSLVAYALDVTNVDPIRYRLYFERFLNELRGDDWPDLDVDFCWRGRDEVIDYVYDRFGRDRVAMISTHNHYHPRSAFRDAARAFGVPSETVNRVSRRIPRRDDRSLPEIFRTGGLLRDYPADREPHRTALLLAERIRGFPRHLGVHPGGIVLTDGPMDRHAPLEEAVKGIMVTQFEMEAAEKAGLVKIDLLGNRAISTIRETLDLVREGGGGTIDLDEIPHDDPATAELIREGRTLGCFQIESPGMRNLLRMIGSSSMGETIAAHSLIRPGPASSGMKEKFIRRAHGLEPVDYPHPELKDLLSETLGVPLYQEDVMAVASRIAGISLAEGDLLRRRIGAARDEESMRALAGPFLARAVARGVHPRAAKEVWGMIARFSAYAFCKAHAAGYGVLAYQTAYLKANRPAEHAVALLNNHQGMYPSRVHLEEARRRDIPIRLPCANRSAEGFTLDEGAIRIGLGRVRNLSEPVRERILRERPFLSLADFLRRTRPPRREAENLILVGAFDWTGETRTRLLWELYGTYEERRKGWGAPEGMFDEEPSRSIHTDLDDFTLEERMRHEMEILGLAVSAHPIALLRAKNGDGGRDDTRTLRERRGGTVRLVGLAAASRRVRTARGAEMLFLTLEDEFDLVECTLFPALFRRSRPALRGAGPFRLEGRIEEQYGVRTVNVSRIESLAAEEPLLGVLDPPEEDRFFFAV
ncbi:MAG: DNA polymerase III subunit alpha [Candidatus Eisenbacteria bacterium]|nr:DNA polymerase III subunit alpha [Candidatus Eisenbacteria bacterium]